MRALSPLLVGGVSTLSLNATLAAAQEEGAPVDLGTLILRGELQARTVQDSPTSATIETGEDLERKGDTDLQDVIARTPGVSTSFGEQGFSIRGIDQRGAGGGGAGLVVSTQIDGVALPTNQATFYGPYSAWDIEQVEVLRGPQSTQQGRNALAGAIVVRSKDPTFEREFKLRGELGSRGYYRAAFAANTPLSDTVALRFSAETVNVDGTIFNATLGENADAHRIDTYRLKFLWEPTDTFRAIASFSRTENFAGEDSINRTISPEGRVVQLDIPTREGSRHDIFGLRTEWDINAALTLETETSYYTQDYVRSEDGDGFPVFLSRFDRVGETEVFEQDVRLSFDTGAYSGVVGLFYTNIQDSIPADLLIDTGFALTQRPEGANGIFANRFSDVVTDVENAAIFGEVDIRADRWLDGLSFTVGARYDYEEFAFDADIVYDAPVPLPPQFRDQSAENSTSFNAFLPKFGINYEFSDTQRVSFTIQRGYRSGGTSINAANSISNFDPEFTTNYELAYRGSFNADSVFVAANVFFTDWTDQQVNRFAGTLPTGQTVFDVVNAGKSELRGGELSVEAEVTERFSVFGQVAYSDTEFVEFVNNGVDLAGNDFPGAAELTAAFGARYDWDNGVSWAFDASYTQGSFLDIENTQAQRSDDRWVVNSYLTYEMDDLQLGLYVRNLFDEEYATNRSVDETGITFERLGEPRTIGVYVQRSF
ncbi:TonB-dependent receptor [Tateyamaria sp. ANG-S1]|uniref:TonB-dependent receptor n=1 Tax=Tateyamaria sp. ANG-S1 TaxID=1577905 RepID=UPI0009E248ED|nr:TonB-dependent receptor [Tateyamaria sp. ANG-S1]